MFAELEPVMVYDQNNHLSLNQTAVEWYGFSPYDVELCTRVYRRKQQSN